MNDRYNECLESNFFSTQPSIKSQQNKQFILNKTSNFIYPKKQNRRYVKSSFDQSKYEQQIIKQSQYLLKRKQAKNKLLQSKKMYEDEFKQTQIQIRNYDMLQHKKSIFQHHFLSLFQIRRQKLKRDEIKNKHLLQKQLNIKSSTQFVKQKRIQRQSSLEQLKKKQQLLKQQLSKNNKKEKQKYNQLFNTTLKEQNKWKLAKVNQILHSNAILQKQKIQNAQINSMKSKFNYYMKLNEQKQKIIRYQTTINKIKQQNPQFMQNQPFFYSSYLRNNNKKQVT